MEVQRPLWDKFCKTDFIAFVLRDTTPATGRHQILYLHLHPHPVPGYGKPNCQLIMVPDVVTDDAPCPWFATETDSKAPDPVLFYLVTATR